MLSVAAAVQKKNNLTIAYVVADEDDGDRNDYVEDENSD